MKRNLMYAALLAAALMVSCNGKNTAQNEANTDSTSVTDTTAAESVDLAAVAGTYEGTLPAADCRHQDRAHYQRRQHISAAAGLYRPQGWSRRGKRRAGGSRQQRTDACSSIERRAHLLQG